MAATIGLMRGDFIGPEIMAATLPILSEVSRQSGKGFAYVNIPAAGDAYDLTGEHLPASSIEAARDTDAVLKAPFGGPPGSDHPKWKNLEVNAIQPLRQELGVYANLRPVNSRLSHRLVELSPLKAPVIEGVDMLFVRDLAGDVYFGDKGSGIDQAGQEYAYETVSYTEPQVRQIVIKGLELALRRRGKLTLVHKANILTETGGLWERVFKEVTSSDPGVETSYMYVDAMAAALVTNPRQFDTVVLPNMFGDILTDQASATLGSIGLGGSASLGKGLFGLYEPIHGSSPEIGGQGLANPTGMILSAALMLRHSLSMPGEAAAIEQAVGRTLDAGYMTSDLYGRIPTLERSARGVHEVSTAGFGGQVVKELRQAA